MGGRLRVVCSLTTTPAFIDEIEGLLKCLTAQFDAVYLGIPAVSEQTGAPYRIPDFITQSRVQVVMLERDYGPICKIMGALLREADPTTVIVTVDDDHLYPNIRHEAEAAANRYPDAAVSNGGMVAKYRSLMNSTSPFLFFMSIAARWFDKNYIYSIIRDRRLTTIAGYCGCVYRRSFFGADFPNYVEKHVADPDVRRHDDFLLSAYLASHGVPRYQGQGLLLTCPTPLATALRPGRISTSADFWPSLFRAFDRLKPQFRGDPLACSILTGFDALFLGLAILLYVIA